MFLCRDCRASYPIVSGIAILLPADAHVGHFTDTTADTASEGPLVRNLIDLVFNGQHDAALASLVLPPSNPSKLRLARAVTRRLRPHKPARSEMAVARLARKRWKKRVPRTITDPNATAVEAFDAYYRRPNNPELGRCFTYRLRQPRHLAALAVAQLLDKDA